MLRSSYPEATFRRKESETLSPNSFEFLKTLCRCVFAGKIVLYNFGHFSFEHGYIKKEQNSFSKINSFGKLKKKHSPCLLCDEICRHFDVNTRTANKNVTDAFVLFIILTLFYFVFFSVMYTQ